MRGSRGTVLYGPTRERVPARHEVTAAGACLVSAPSKERSPSQSRSSGAPEASYRGPVGNVFGGGEQSLYLSNGGTEVFIDVLMLAVSDLADDVWDYRFAALLTLQDQNVMGRGAVGFDLQDIEWGATPRERAQSKDFMLHAATLALRRHRWSELGYAPD